MNDNHDSNLNPQLLELAGIEQHDYERDNEILDFAMGGADLMQQMDVPINANHETYQVADAHDGNYSTCDNATRVSGPLGSDLCVIDKESQYGLDVQNGAAHLIGPECQVIDELVNEKVMHYGLDVQNGVAHLVGPECQVINGLVNDKEMHYGLDVQIGITHPVGSVCQVKDGLVVQSGNCEGLDLSQPLIETNGSFNISAVGSGHVAGQESQNCTGYGAGCPSKSELAAESLSKLCSQANGVQGKRRGADRGKWRPGRIRKCGILGVNWGVSVYGDESEVLNMLEGMERRDMGAVGKIVVE
ncbi:peptidylprolyl isomerase [Sesbania bispinosa]|nr:peptidylprolyl isomerase [Sesbania bispinosa]